MVEFAQKSFSRIRSTRLVVVVFGLAFLLPLLICPRILSAREPGDSEAKTSSASGKILKREGDIVRVAGGTFEGFATGDTCLFIHYSRHGLGGKEWEGFGRIVGTGEFGDAETGEVTRVEVISEYESGEAFVEAVPDSSIGLQLGFGGGIVPLRHGPTNLAVGDVAEKQANANGLMLDLRLRIPYVPLTELYLTGSFSWLRSPSPLEALFFEPGIEKGWLWGRFSPVIGMRYSLGRLAMPVVDVFGRKSATALAHGVEGYSGIKIFITPRALFHLTVGYRHHSKITQFDANGRVYYFRNPQGGVWSVKLSGVAARAILTYEI